MSAVSSAVAASQAGSSQSLNQADFLQLLVTQMTSQDPLNPESDTDFAAQLAQFSSLQETQEMESDLESIQGTSLIGQTVTVLPSGGGLAVTGIVTSVQMNAGTTQILVNGQAYDLNQVAAITPTLVPASSNTTPTSTQN